MGGRRAVSDKPHTVAKRSARVVLGLVPRIQPAANSRRYLGVESVQQDKTYFVYILASRPHGTLYIGVTNDLARRLIEHREGRADGFTKKYSVTQLVWFETYCEVLLAIQREKSLKRWRRDWKINLIEQTNPHWQDLAHVFLGLEAETMTKGESGALDPRDEPEDDR